jgi:hypothetical protein
MANRRPGRSAVTNYNAKGMHEQTDRLLGEYVIAAGEAR